MATVLAIFNILTKQAGLFSGQVTARVMLGLDLLQIFVFLVPPNLTYMESL